MWELLPLLVIFALFWLLIIRPAQRRQRAQGQMQASLAVDETVMLTSGFYGTLRRLGEDTVDVEIAENVRVTVSRAAVAKVVAPEELSKDAEAPQGSATVASDDPAGSEKSAPITLEKQEN